jgi:hypothetical protein
MIAVPVLRPILLKRTVPLPGAMLCPSPLLLPRHRLLLCALRLLLLPGLLGTLCLRLLRPLPLRLGRLRVLLWLRLLGALLLLWLLLTRLLRPLLLRLRRLRVLLLLRLLGALLLWLLLPRLLGPLLLRLGRLRVLLLRLLGALLLWLLLPRLLGPLLLRLRRLRVLLLLRLLGALLLRLLSRSCVLLLRLLVLLLSARQSRVRRDNRPDKQKQGGGARCSNQLHSDGPPLRPPLSVHADDQRGLPVCQGFRFLRFRLGLLHRPLRVVGR